MFSNSLQTGGAATTITKPVPSTPPSGPAGSGQARPKQPTQPTKKSYSALENAWVGPGTHQDHRTGSRQNSFGKLSVQEKATRVHRETPAAAEHLEQWTITTAATAAASPINSVPDQCSRKEQENLLLKGARKSTPRRSTVYLGGLSASPQISLPTSQVNQRSSRKNRPNLQWIQQ